MYDTLIENLCDADFNTFDKVAFSHAYLLRSTYTLEELENLSKEVSSHDLYTNTE